MDLALSALSALSTRELQELQVQAANSASLAEMRNFASLEGKGPFIRQKKHESYEACEELKRRGVTPWSIHDGDGRAFLTGQVA